MVLKIFALAISVVIGCSALAGYRDVGNGGGSASGTSTASSGDAEAGPIDEQGITNVTITGDAAKAVYSVLDETLVYSPSPGSKVSQNISCYDIQEKYYCTFHVSPTGITSRPREEGNGGQP